MACTFSTAQLPKVLQEWCAFTILTFKCASRHNSVHFFDISIQKSSEPVSSLTGLTSKSVSRHNSVHFSTAQLSKVVQKWCVFQHFDFQLCFQMCFRRTWQFSTVLISKRGDPPLWRAYFSILPSPKTLGKQSVPRLFFLFAQLHLLSSDFFSFLSFFFLPFSYRALPTSAFHLSTLSEE